MQGWTINSESLGTEQAHPRDSDTSHPPLTSINLTSCVSQFFYVTHWDHLDLACPYVGRTK